MLRILYGLVYVFVWVTVAWPQSAGMPPIPAEVIDLCRILKDQIINRGVDVGIDRDAIGMPRPSGGGVDIGAIECDSGKSPDTSPSPDPVAPLPPKPPAQPPIVTLPPPKPPVVVLPPPLPGPTRPVVTTPPALSSSPSARLTETDVWRGVGATAVPPLRRDIPGAPPVSPGSGRLTDSCVWKGACSE